MRPGTKTICLATTLRRSAKALTVRHLCEANRGVSRPCLHTRSVGQPACFAWGHWMDMQAAKHVGRNKNSTSNCPQRQISSTHIIHVDPSAMVHPDETHISVPIRQRHPLASPTKNLVLGTDRHTNNNWADASLDNNASPALPKPAPSTEPTLNNAPPNHIPGSSLQ